jgi:AraC family transcriptional regulator of adaptative response/methylated-DNA-[protein]-cysteine methyltransferase
MLANARDTTAITLSDTEGQQSSAEFVSDAQRWAAVVARNPAADGAFYYSVRTTGVYCRPSCGSRTARRENVGFHMDCAAAEAAGFRPCKRCRPNEGSLTQRQAESIARACRLIETSIESPTLDELAATAGLSRFHFHRVFKQQTGLTPKAYTAGHRSDRVRAELTRTQSVTDAIYEAGFNSSARFYASAGDTLGMTPTEFRKGAPDASIRFGIGQCSLGAILVAASEQGVCAILLGDDADALARDLQDRFPKAALKGGDAAFEQWMAAVIGLVEAPRVGLTLPLDVRGTAFQQRVWKALRDIPVGTTATYAAIANSIGAPKAVRAVAQACGANALAVAIPCHRVIRTDNGLSGYRWGVERKRALLDRERQK